jgi:hypothetical protein
MRSKSKIFLDKSIEIMVAAISIYNKPNAEYREESFAILSINAWEILLKSKILELSKNNKKSIYVMEQKNLKDGRGKSKRKTPKLNRSGNPTSISISECFSRLNFEFKCTVPAPIQKNVEAMIEIRDNSIHFVNRRNKLSIKVQELGTALLKNYLFLLRQWFDKNLSEYNFYLMPLSFFGNFIEMESAAIGESENKVLRSIQRLEIESNKSLEDSDYSFSLRVDIKFQKSKDATNSIPVKINKDNPNSTEIILKEEDILEKYPWTYQKLTDSLKERYSDFKQNQKYHQIRKNLENERKYVYTRYLDPSNKEGSKKVMYNPNIIKDEFDKYYAKR